MPSPVDELLLSSCIGNTYPSYQPVFRPGIAFEEVFLGDAKLLELRISDRFLQEVLLNIGDKCRFNSFLIPSVFRSVMVRDMFVQVRRWTLRSISRISYLGC